MEQAETKLHTLNDGHAGAPHLLRGIYRTHQAMLAGLSRVAGMPLTRLGILRGVGVSGERGMGIVELARSLGLDAAAITRQVAAMEREGLLQRSGDPSDKRRVCVRLSGKGRDAFGVLHSQIHAYEEQLVSGISSEDLVTALRVLEVVRVAILAEAGGVR
jgi:DNA-binding MarR family transcriptional regulator